MRVKALACVALALIKDDLDVSTSMIQQGKFTIDLGGELANATTHLRAAYDPDSEKTKSS